MKLMNYGDDELFANELQLTYNRKNLKTLLTINEAKATIDFVKDAIHKLLFLDVIGTIGDDDVQLELKEEIMRVVLHKPIALVQAGKNLSIYDDLENGGTNYDFFATPIDSKNDPKIINKNRTYDNFNLGAQATEMKNQSYTFIENLYSELEQYCVYIGI